MLICSSCGHQNADGLTHCEKCNAVLRKDDTVLIPALQEQEETADAKQAKLPTTHTTTTSPLILAFQDQDTADQLTLPASAKHYIVGRGEDQTIPVDIDLVPFKARQLGVSRRHAKIYLKEGNWVVEDLESKNGTYLNSARLQPREAYPLKTDDRLQFAHVTVKVQLEAQ